MNLEKMSLLKFFKVRLRTHVSLSEKKITHTSRDWMIGLGFTTIAFLFTATYFGYHFYSHMTEVKTEGGEGVSSVEYKRSEVESIIATYRERKTTFEELRRIRNVAPVTPPVVSEEESVPLAEEQDGQYSSDAMIAPVME